MEYADAFLLASAIAYYIAVFLPKPVTKNVKNRAVERAFMWLSGTILLIGLIYNYWLLWLCMGVFWVLAAGLSYLGYTEWNVLWRKDVSDESQMVMWLWDLCIAVSCLAKLQ